MAEEDIGDPNMSRNETSREGAPSGGTLLKDRLGTPLSGEVPSSDENFGFKPQRTVINPLTGEPIKPMRGGSEPASSPREGKSEGEDSLDEPLNKADIDNLFKVFAPRIRDLDEAQLSATDEETKHQIEREKAAIYNVIAQNVAQSNALRERMIQGDKSLGGQEDLPRGGADLYGITSEMYRESEDAVKAEAEDQIGYVSKLMSELEYTRQSYGNLQSNPEFVILVRNLHKFKPEAQQYFRARYTIYETWLKLPYIGGDVEGFTKGVAGATSIDIQATILSQPEVADALTEIEERSHLFGSNNNPTKDNVIFADPIRRMEIHEEMALSLAERAGEIQKEPEEDGKEVYVYPENTNKELFVKKYIWAIRQADSLHRIWFRTALADGLVFKEGTTEAEKQQILSWNPKQKSERWDFILQKVDFNDSFGGNAEFGVRRLVWEKMYLQKSVRGESKIRRYITWGAGDFLSHKIDAKFLKKETNFLDGKSFEEGSLVYVDDKGQLQEMDYAPFKLLEAQQEETDEQEKVRKNENKKRLGALVKWKKDLGDRFIGTVYVKNTDNPQNIERVLIRQNEVWEIFEGINHQYQGRFRFNNVKWRVLDEDVFPGDFYYRKADLAEAVRKETMGADKILRDPRLEKILGLGGALENFTPIQEAIEKEWQSGNLELKKADGSINWKKGMEWIEKNREEGAIYREDVIGMLARGLLEFQRSPDYKRRFGQPKIDWRSIDLSIRGLQGAGLLDQQASSQLRRDLLAFDGMPTHEFVAHLLVHTYYVRPHEALLEMFLEFFKQITRNR